MVEFLRRFGGISDTYNNNPLIFIFYSAVLFLSVVAFFVFGDQLLALREDGSLGELMGRYAATPWAIFGVIGIFSVFALAGFPQILLITATVFAFGAEMGALFSWVATMVSATLTYGIGRLLGGDWVGRLGGVRGQRAIDFLRRRGGLASGIIRIVPSGPFVMVNAAAGAAQIPIWKYWLGTGIGIVPKILLVAILGVIADGTADLATGHGADPIGGQGVSGSGFLALFNMRFLEELATMGLVITIWLIFIFASRAFYLKLLENE